MLKNPKPLATIFLAIITTITNLPLTTSSANSCADVEAIFARGSGNPLNTSEDYLAFKSALSNELASRHASVSTKFYDLGTSPHAGHQYPAVSIKNPSVLLGAAIGSGQAYAFGKSVKEGIAELNAYIDEISKICSNTKFVLAGYSQGAMLISSAIQKLDPNKILYAATFGDPKLYLPEGRSIGLVGKPLACSGKNLSNYRIDVPDCEIEAGILGGIIPYQLPVYTDKLGTWCNEADFMCGSYFDFAAVANSTNAANPFSELFNAHLAYHSDGSYLDAAKIISDAIAKAYPEKVKFLNYAKNTHQDLAILLDVTGSMNSLIDQYRSEALNLAQKIKQAGGTVSLYIYGDELEDGFTPRIICDDSCTLTNLETKLNEITIYGGGETPESALSALLHVMNTMTWHKGANKSIVLLTDANYHSVDIRGITLNDVVKRSYEIDPVGVFVITPPENTAYYSDLTNQTGGQIFSSTTDIPLSTETIADRPYINIGEVHFSSTPPATITDHSLTYATAAATIHLSSNATAYYLSLDDAPLGLTQTPDFTLTELSATSTLTITPINSDGRPSSPLSITLTPPQPANPTSHDPASLPENTIVIPSKAPQAGTL